MMTTFAVRSSQAVPIRDDLRSASVGRPCHSALRFATRSSTATTTAARRTVTAKASTDPERMPTSPATSPAAMARPKGARGWRRNRIRAGCSAGTRVGRAGPTCVPWGSSMHQVGWDGTGPQPGRWIAGQSRRRQGPKPSRPVPSGDTADTSCTFPDTPSRLEKWTTTTSARLCSWYVACCAQHVSSGVRMLTPPIGRASGGPDLLIVDGDPATRQALREFLAGAGFASEEAADADSALGRAGGSKPAAIVLHDCLSGAQGLEILESLRVHHPDVPVVFIAQSGEPETRAAAARCAVTAYVNKPFRLADLLVTIVRAVDGPARSRQRAVRRAPSRQSRSRAERAAG